MDVTLINGAGAIGGAGASFDRQTAKLKDGAQQFEAMMLGEMLKPLHFGGAEDPDGDKDDDKAGGTIESFGTEALTKAIAGGGGFGIARQILRQVTAERNARQGEGESTKV